PHGSSAEVMTKTLPRGTLQRLLEREGGTLSYTSLDGAEVVGSLKKVPRVRWAVVSEIHAATAFRQVRRFRNLTLLIVGGLLVAVSAIAYRLGLIIAAPLIRLTKGAAEVAAGDLAVDLPAAGGGEVGYLTQVFNHMVSRLREGRQALDSANRKLRDQNKELELLSTTDGLTGLSNRRQLTQRLLAE